MRHIQLDVWKDGSLSSLNYLEINWNDLWNLSLHAFTMYYIMYELWPWFLYYDEAVGFSSSSEFLTKH